MGTTCRDMTKNSQFESTSQPVFIVFSFAGVIEYGHNKVCADTKTIHRRPLCSDRLLYARTRTGGGGNINIKKMKK